MSNEVQRLAHDELHRREIEFFERHQKHHRTMFRWQLVIITLLLLHLVLLLLPAFVCAC